MAGSLTAADVKAMSEPIMTPYETATTVPGDVTGAMVRGGRLAALGELAAGAAHEINNPLFAILTLVGFLVRDAEPGTKAFERLQLIEGSAKDIQAVVERVHGFARERGGNGSVFALEEVAHDAVELVRYASATRTVQFIEQYSTSTSEVAGDSTQLKGLFVHLLVNALQAMPEGGIVTLEIERDAGEVVTRVRDEGPGIAASETERIFELFHTTKNGAGTGLGLASARAIAGAHGGSLAADLDVPRGACFVLRLPEAAQ
jgi:signal transduction histidine kinase